MGGAALNNDVTGVEDRGARVENQLESTRHDDSKIKCWSCMPRVFEARRPRDQAADHSAWRGAIGGFPIGRGLQCAVQSGRDLPDNPEVHAPRVVLVPCGARRNRRLRFDARTTFRIYPCDDAPADLYRHLRSRCLTCHGLSGSGNKPGQRGERSPDESPSFYRLNCFSLRQGDLLGFSPTLTCSGSPKTGVGCPDLSGSAPTRTSQSRTALAATGGYRPKAVIRSPCTSNLVIRPGHRNSLVP